MRRARRDLAWAACESSLFTALLCAPLRALGVVSGLLLLAGCASMRVSAHGHLKCSSYSGSAKLGPERH